MTAVISCTNPQCTIAVNGICADGQSPVESCPKFIRADSPADVEDYPDDEGESDGAQQGLQSPLVSLQSGEALTQSEVEEFLLARGAKFITVIGDSFSGKTTLVCALYDLFLKGLLGDTHFAGSQTLIALEKRSHYSRVDSGRLTPDTPRTSHLEGLAYFHFSTKAAATASKKARVDLMISDRAGETYKKARDNSSLIPELVEIPRADIIILLLDGERIIDNVQRSAAMQSVRQSLRAFIDNGALDLRSTVQVVTTKYDLIETKGFDGLEGLLSAFNDRLQTEFGPRLGGLSFWKIAARPEFGGRVAGDGIAALLSSWLTTTPASPPVTNELPLLRSEFDKLLLRPRMEALL